MVTTAATTTGKHTIVGVFDGPNHAEQALNGLKAAGEGGRWSTTV